MKIERTCKIELTVNEVKEAITAYIQEKHRYSHGKDKISAFEECRSYYVNRGGGIAVVWGEADEAEAVAPEATLSETPSDTLTNAVTAA